MKQFIITVLGVVVGLFLFFVGGLFVLGAVAAGSMKPVATAADTVLSLDLREGLTDQDSPNPILSLGGGSLSVMTVVQTLRHAEGDQHVKGLFIRLPEGGMDPAAADELRQAVQRFRAARKAVFVHSQGLYASGIATSTYMLAASADEFWMQPGAPFEATGVSTEDIFFKRAFDKYGVTADFEQREEYKNAVNPYLFSDYTLPHRQSQQAWMTSIYQAGLANAAADRKLRPEVLQAAIERGPYDAAQAASNGLVDRIGQVHDAEVALRKRVGGKGEFVDFGDYADTPPSTGSGPTIAVIRVEGAIVTGSGGGGVSPFGETSAYSDDVAKAFYAAAADSNVKAIVFRVSSPGGTDTAAEQIAAAVRAAKAAGKPVVVSMGSYAASGGYWISADASSIIAQPTTLTGSIGVYGGKFAVGDALSRFGVDVREITVGGEFAGVGSLGHGFTPAQRAAYSAQIDRVYERFVARVAAGRNMAPARVRELAKGRVWTGTEAKQLGLVDELGGLTEAIEKAKSLAKITGPVRLKMLPREMSPFEALEQMLGVSAEGVRTLAAAAWLAKDPRAEAMMDQLMKARLRSSGANVLAPVQGR